MSIDSAPSPPTLKHPALKDRRDEQRKLGLCICGPGPSTKKDAMATPPRTTAIVHGPAIKGGKCQRCINVHRGWEPGIRQNRRKGS